MGNKIICIVGMAGSGKSMVSDELVKSSFLYLRFGQITLDKIKEQGLEINEANEKETREGFRKEYGMPAFAILNIPKIDELLQKSNVVVDGLYSWSEYKILKEKYGDDLIVIAVYASPETRYQRISQRQPDANDKNLRQHHFSVQEAKARDYAEIENIEKGGPIVMADYTLHNEGTPEELYQQLAELNLF